MVQTIRLTMAQALTRRLSLQQIKTDRGELLPFCRAVMAIYGHGNVAGLGEALFQTKDVLPVYRAHNEQSMAHLAIAYAKASFRERIMAVTTSIGPGATNLVTAAALAHVNRLPVLLLPGDIFVSRAPDPVLQQLEHPEYGDWSVNDCLRPVSRYFDRIVHPQQILNAVPRAFAVMTDPENTGPVTLALPQDVQTMAFDCPQSFFEELEPLVIPRLAPDARQLQRAAEKLKAARRPFFILGGGVLYSQASEQIQAVAEKWGVPMAETQAGKGSIPWDHSLNLGAIGVTGSPSANELASQADLIVAIGTRLQDFTTASHSLFGSIPLVSINLNSQDAIKMQANPLKADVRLAILALEKVLAGYQAESSWTAKAKSLADNWRGTVSQLITAEVPKDSLPYDAEVIGAVQGDLALATVAANPFSSDRQDVVVGAAGTLPAELHKLWRVKQPGGYHMEYGYSCMGYEIAAGIGVKMAFPEKQVVVMVGDGSYLMLNSELHSSLMLNAKIVVVVLDNQGFGCIERLQQASGGESFNNMLEDCYLGSAHPVDFALHAKSLGAESYFVTTIPALKDALEKARKAPKSAVVVIKTTHRRTTEQGGFWWEVAIPEVSSSKKVEAARQRYEANKKNQSLV